MNIFSAGNLYFIELDETRVNHLLLCKAKRNGTVASACKGGILKASDPRFKENEYPVYLENNETELPRVPTAQRPAQCIAETDGSGADRMDRILEGAVMHITRRTIHPIAAAFRAYIEMKLPIKAD